MVLKQVILFRVCRAAGLVTVMVVLGCGGGDAAARGPAGPPPPPYGERDAVLFDDGVEPGALGFGIAGITDKDERLVNDRVAASDGVVRARVVTVTSKTEDSGTGLFISFRTIETLAGHGAPRGDFVVFESSKASGAGLLMAAASRLVGLTFIAYVRRFAGAPRDGAEAPDESEREGVLHFHLAKDGKDEQDRVRAGSLASFH
ncbi:MAG: hypothetical protein ACRENE_28510 [Polyangiaceae bacterium]